jgi:hypothetical protein
MWRHYFAVVLPIDDGTPAARAAAMLRYQLPARFPEHHSHFIDQAEMTKHGAATSSRSLNCTGGSVAVVVCA